MKEIDEAFLYDLDCIDYTYDIKFYRNFCNRIRGEILEIGAGTGRITLPLLEDGHKVYALDNSSEQLNFLIQKCEKEKYSKLSKNLTIVHGDATDFKFDIDFSRIILPFNFLHLLSDNEEILSCLNCVKNSLKKSGKGVISIFIPDTLRISSHSTDIHNFTRYIEKNFIISQFEKSFYDSSKQILKVEYDYFIKQNGEQWTQKKMLNLKLIFPNEMLLLLKYSGLKVENIYGDFDGRDFNNKSPHMIIVFRK